jgi:hypothetical protein
VDYTASACCAWQWADCLDGMCGWAPGEVGPRGFSLAARDQGVMWTGSVGYAGCPPTPRSHSQRRRSTRALPKFTAGSKANRQRSRPDVPCAGAMSLCVSSMRGFSLPVGREWCRRGAVSVRCLSLQLVLTGCGQGRHVNAVQAGAVHLAARPGAALGAVLADKFC